MKKTDLKIGETYACHIRPARGRYDYGSKPFKATLVALSGTVTLKEQKTVRKVDGHVYTDFTKEHGIVVELDEPIVRERDEYILARGYDRESEAAIAVLKTSTKVTDTWTQRALKNAGCFMSTWADYEADQAQKAELEKKRDAQNAAAKAKEVAEADDAEEQVVLARHKLAVTFGDEHVEVERQEWRGAIYRYGDYQSRVRLEEKLGNWTRRPVNAEITLGMDALLGVDFKERYILVDSDGNEVGDTFTD